MAKQSKTVLIERSILRKTIKWARNAVPCDGWLIEELEGALAGEDLDLSRFEGIKYVVQTMNIYEHNARGKRVWSSGPPNKTKYHASCADAYAEMTAFADTHAKMFSPEARYLKYRVRAVYQHTMFERDDTGKP